METELAILKNKRSPIQVRPPLFTLDSELTLGFSE
jgi:hypothetical protein